MVSAELSADACRLQHD